MKAEKFRTDDGRPWGWMCNGTWLPIPKTPLLLAELGPPPFDVVLPSGQVRHILHEPSAAGGVSS